MLKQITTRMLDLALLAMLVGPHQSAKTFAFVLVSIMVALMLIGTFSMSADLAQTLMGRGAVRTALGIAIQVLYVAALIYAGFPVLAALYATTAASLRVAAQSKLTAQEQH